MRFGVENDERQRRYEQHCRIGDRRDNARAGGHTAESHSRTAPMTTMKTRAPLVHAMRPRYTVRVPVWQAVGYAGLALFYAGGALVVLLGAWFFARLLRGDVRAIDVQRSATSLQRLVIFATAVAGFGAGIVLLSLGFRYGHEVLFLPPGFGMVGLSVLIAVYGATWGRRRL